MYRQEIEEACQKDAEMQALITAIRKNLWPRKPAGNTNNKFVIHTSLNIYTRNLIKNISIQYNKTIK